MFKCRAPDCDSYYDLTYFWKAGFYDFPAFGGGNKTTLETSSGFFLSGEKSTNSSFNVPTEVIWKGLTQALSILDTVNSTF